MKRILILLAVALIAVGAFGDHVLSGGFGQGRAAAPPTSTTSIASAPSHGASNPAHPVSAPSSPSVGSQATEQAFSVASPSVVYVANVGVGSGSGVIYDTHGDIITNNHVVSGASKLKVTLNDGRVFTATVLGTDQADDLAVIHINAPNLTPAHFATAGGYQIAETVLAIGSPLGLKQSVTSGLISGLHRVEQEPSGAYLPDTIQTSAPINPGNSGGALVALDGTVVGIPTLVQSSSSNGTAAQNIGFAIPSQRVVSIASQIIATGKVQHTGRAFLGIAPTDASSQPGSDFGGGFNPFGPGQTTPSPTGALVSRLSATGPAAKAGVQQGDVITQANGMTISSAEDLLTVLAQEKPGNTMSLKINRSGTTMSLTVKLGELPG
ncbi:MAG: S1C family serine protease [Chloroflexota bacterium]